MRGQLLTSRESDRFLRNLLTKERKFFQAGVSYDRKTGMTFDGHPTDIQTGELRALPRTWSAASKEMLHVSMLVKAIEGDPIAQQLLSPDPRRPEKAVKLALDVLERKISTYERFHREHPGFGGFLPWYLVKDGRIEPTQDWQDRVPGLDNGQLAWGVYLAANVLRDRGHAKLANRYRSHFDLMAKNVVPIFFDGKHGQFRAEAKLANGSAVPPEQNQYSTQGRQRMSLRRGPESLRRAVNKVIGRIPSKPYLLDDAYEGLMLVHFADLFGNWKGQPDAASERPWRHARRRAVSYRVDKKQEITVMEGHWFSSHEEWGFLTLPFRDHEVANRLYLNGQRARTIHSAKNGWPAHEASTTDPVDHNTFDLGYRSAQGIPGIGKELVTPGKRVFAPYASFPLALVNKRLFASWLKSALSPKGASGPLGIGESYDLDGKSTPLLTWDGKALPALAMMGGIENELRQVMKRDGVYDKFMTRVQDGYRMFDPKKIRGEDIPFAAPPEKYLNARPSN